jgi:hypothetical protein
MMLCIMAHDKPSPHRPGVFQNANQQELMSTERVELMCLPVCSHILDVLQYLLVCNVDGHRKAGKQRSPGDGHAQHLRSPTSSTLLAC